MSTDAREHADVVLEVLECPNLDAPYHTEVGCSICSRTKPARDSVKAIVARVEELERERDEWQEISREGMVTVHDHELNYVGCMGSESWAWLLEHGYERCRSDAARVATLEAALRDAWVRELYNEKGALVWIADAEKKGQTVAEQLVRLDQLRTGAVL